MSLGAKIGIVGLAVIALVAGGLYYIFVYARNGVKETVTGINRDSASATNAVRDPGEPVAIDPDGTPRYGGLIEYPQGVDYRIQPILNSTSVSLAGGAQNMAALPALTGNSLALNTPARGFDYNPEMAGIIQIGEKGETDPNLISGFNSNFTQGRDAFGVQVRKFIQNRTTGEFWLYPFSNGRPYAWQNVIAQGKTWGGADFFMPENVPAGTVAMANPIFGGN